MATIEEIQAELASRQPSKGVTIEQIQAELASRQPENKEIDFSQIDPMEDISLFGITPSDVAGTANLAQNIATSIPAQVVGGVTAIPSIVSGDPQKGLEAVQKAQKDIQTPLSESGLEVAGKLGETISSLGDSVVFKPIVDQLKRAQSGFTDIMKQTGAFIADPVSATVSQVSDQSLSERAKVGEGIGEAFSIAGPQTALEVAGFKGAGSAPKIASKVIPKATKATRKVVKKIGSQSPTKQKIAELIQAGSDDVATAKFKLEDSIISGAPKIVKDKIASESIKQGFNEGVIAAVKGSSSADKAKMLKMVDVMERGKRNALYAVKNRPSSIAGDSLMERFKAVRDVNRSSGIELDKVAKTLKGKKVDNTAAINDFSNALDEMGVTFDKVGSPIFKGSDIEGLGGSMKAVRQIIGRLKSVKSSDAHEMHRLKRFIDENVTYGSSGEGLKGSAERVLKRLRSKVDESLDESFPKYDAVNQKYADTIDALNSFQDVAGKKMNLSAGSADDATGTLLRRLMSNAQSRVRLLDAVNNIESTAKKYGSSFDDDLLTQVLFVDELDSVFGPVAKTSFQGQIRQAIPATKADAAIKVAEAGIKKVRGVNEEGAFKAIKDLLND